MAIPRDLFIDQGSAFAAELAVTDIANQPFNLTGCTAFSDLKKWQDAESAVVSFTCTITGDPTEGKILLSLTDEETATIPARKYFYDVIIKNSVDQVFRVVEGLTVVTPGVTRPA